MKIIAFSTEVVYNKAIGASPSGKARDFDSRIHTFKSYRPCQTWASPKRETRNVKHETLNVSNSEIERFCPSLYVSCLMFNAFHKREFICLQKLLVQWHNNYISIYKPNTQFALQMIQRHSPRASLLNYGFHFI